MAWKRALFLFWLFATVCWVPVAKNKSHAGLAMEMYRSYWAYEQQIEDGDDSDYIKHAYRRAYDDLAEANHDLGMFFLLAMGLPGLALAAGTMVLKGFK